MSLETAALSASNSSDGSEPPENETTEFKDSSFYGRNFKSLRVTGDVLYSLIASLFHKIISGGSWTLHLKAANHHHSALASYHIDQSLIRMLTYVLFGDSIINFSVNSTGKVKELNSGNELEKLEEIYGNKFSQMHKNANTEKFPISPKNLSRLPISEGICLGIGLDYISRFLKLQNTKANYLENIKRVSQLYTEKGTQEAQITQILFAAQKTDGLIKDMSIHFGKLEQDINNQKKAIKRQLDKEVKTVKSLLNQAKEYSPEMKKKNGNKIQKEVSQIQNAFAHLLNNLNDKFDRDIIEYTAQCHQHRIIPLATLHGLDLEQKLVIIDKDLQSNTAPKLLNSLLDKLSPGAYLTILCSSGDSGIVHAMVYIKESNERGYILDPGTATIMMDSKQEHSPKGWDVAKFYITKHAYYMQFLQSNLSTSI